MNKILIIALSVLLLASCSDANSDKKSDANTSSKAQSKAINSCDNILIDSVNLAVTANKNLGIKWSKEEERSCGVYFKIGDVDYQVDLELKEIGTANDKKIIGGMDTTVSAVDFKKIGFYKDQEEITNLGDKAIYYNIRDSREVYVLSGDNAFIVKTINWNTRGGNKDITVKVAKMIASKLTK